jgi:hypothetical protein
MLTPSLCTVSFLLLLSQTLILSIKTVGYSNSFLRSLLSALFQGMPWLLNLSDHRGVLHSARMAPNLPLVGRYGFVLRWYMYDFRGIKFSSVFVPPPPSHSIFLLSLFMQLILSIHFLVLETIVRLFFSSWFTCFLILLSNQIYYLVTILI